MSEVFDEMALAAHDHSTIFRGDALPYASDDERIANGQAELAKHIAALASFMRDGGAVIGFKSETMHLHGSSSHGLPAELAIAFGGDILTGEQCWNMVQHWREMPFAPWPGNGVGASSKGDALAILFAHWRGEAQYDFRSKRDAVNSQFSLANRYCSGAHYGELSKAVETATAGMLAKARQLPNAVEALDLAKANSAALFDALALEVSPTAIDPQGRYRDGHTEDYAASAIGEARQRVMAVVESWRLEAQVKGEVPAPIGNSAPAVEASQYLRLWLENKATTATRNVEKLLGEIDAKAAAEGWYQSGGRIKKSVQVFDKHLSDLWVSCFAKARSLPLVQGGYDMASATVASVFRGFAAKAHKIVESAAGARATNNSAYDATDKLMGQLWTDFERASELARFEHEATIDASSPATQPTAARESVDMPNWIASCGTQNGKVAWARFKSHFGASAPKKVEFEIAWRDSTGNRSRGRPRKKLVN